MNHIEFLKKLEDTNWYVKKNNLAFIQNGKKDSVVANKIYKASQISIEFIEYIKSFILLANQEDNIWFLNENDYFKENGEVGFVWNEFEMQSLEYAEGVEEEEKIKEFWGNHLPFMMAVKDGYAFVAIVLDGNEKGSIVAGNEPEYEIVTKIASSIEEFFDIYIKVLTKKLQIPALNMLI